MSKADYYKSVCEAINDCSSSVLLSSIANIMGEDVRQAVIEEIYKILGQYKWHLMTPRECIEAIAAEIAKA